MSAERTPEMLGQPILADENPDFVTAVARGFAVLRAFRGQERFLGIREIARRTGLPKSTIARLAYTLTRLGYLAYVPAEEKYSLGVGVLALGSQYLAGLDARQVARPLLQELAESARATVALGARDGDHMVIVELWHGHPQFRPGFEVGQRVPPGSTGLGRAGLVTLPEPERAARLAAILQNADGRERARVQQTVEQATRDFAQLGFCVAHGDGDAPLFAVAVPLTASGRQTLALSCFGPAHEMSRTRLVDELGPRLVQLRDRIQAELRGAC